MAKAKGFRSEEVKQDLLEKIKASLSPEEAHRLEEMRKYDELKPDTYAFKLAIHNDSLRVAIRQSKEQIWKMIWNIKDIQNKINRCKEQLKSDNIYETIGESKVVMNKYELETYMEHMTWVMKAEVKGLSKHLLQLRANVGHIDIQRNIIMTEDDYESYCKDIEKQVRELGHDIFE